jgi:uncharacterized membrane protein
VSGNRKLLVLALVVSLALNVFLLGFYSARLGRRWSGRGADAFGDTAGLREKWKEQAGGLRGRREAVEAARRNVRTAFAADPFEPQLLAAALAALRRETNETQAAVDEALVRFAATLGPDERKKVAESRWFGSFERRGGMRSH